MRVGVIGVGRMGAHHAHLLSTHPAVTELVLFDTAQQRAAALAAEIGARTVPQVDTLLAATDAVIIATSTSTHAGLVEAAVRAGRTVLCEKPLAPDLPSTRHLLEVIAETGGRVQVGFMRRFDPGIAAARQLVTDGKLGKLYTVRAISNDGEQPPPEAFIATSGGMHADVLIHDIDAIRYVTGEEIVEVFADGSVLVADYFGQHGDIDVGIVLLRLSSGALGVVTASRHDPHGYDVRMELLGSLDSVAVGHDERLPLRRIQDDALPSAAYRDFTERFADAYRNQMDRFLAFVLGTDGNPSSPDDAHAALRVVIACERSLAEHRPVRVEEIS